jgi:hypothetical protein
VGKEYGRKYGMRWMHERDKGWEKWKDDDDDDQWRYSPDRALASLYGFHDSFIV